MLDEGPKELVPWGMNSLSISLEMGQDYCHPLLQVAFLDPSVFKAEQVWFDFTAGWFSNLVTHLERRKNILQKVPYSLSMVAWRCTRNPLVPVKRVLFLDVRGILHIFVKIVGFCPLTQTWEMLRVYKYYGLCPRRNLILLFSNLIIQGQSFTGKKWFIVSILYKSVKLFFKGCRVS